MMESLSNQRVTLCTAGASWLIAKRLLFLLIRLLTVSGTGQYTSNKGAIKIKDMEKSQFSYTHAIGTRTLSSIIGQIKL